MFSLLLISTLIVAAHAIAQGKSGRIEDFPYQVAIETKDSGSYVCGGAIIAKHWIVTAAHRCASKSADELQVRAGSDLRGTGGSLHQVDRIIVHENTHLKQEIVPVNDIALMHLKEPIELDETRQAIPLFESGEKSSPQTLANVTGFGAYAQEDEEGFVNLIDLSETLQWVQVPLIYPNLCDKAYRYHYEGLPKGTICAGFNDVGGENACSGDEGSPLVIRGRLAGVVSWAYNCADPYYPTVYTEIAYYRDWIDQKLGQF